MLRPYNRPTMMVREYTAGDLAALRAIHASQGFAYPLPDLSNPLFVTKLILSDASETETETDERSTIEKTEP
jgi:hypothetical protein